MERYVQAATIVFMSVGMSRTRAVNHTRVGYYVIGCFKDVEVDRDLFDGPYMFQSISHDACARYCVSKGFRYAGLQLKDHMNPKSLVISRMVLCSCGNSYGRHGPIDRCSEPCPKATSVDVKMAAVVERKMAIVGRVGADLRTEICGNVLANIVIYVFFVQASSFPSCETATLVFDALLSIVAAVLVAGTVWLAVKTRQYAVSQWRYWGKSMLTL